MMTHEELVFVLRFANFFRAAHWGVVDDNGTHCCSPEMLLLQQRLGRSPYYQMKHNQYIILVPSPHINRMLVASVQKDTATAFIGSPDYSLYLTLMDSGEVEKKFYDLKREHVK